MNASPSQCPLAPPCPPTQPCSPPTPSISPSQPRSTGSPGPTADQTSNINEAPRVYGFDLNSSWQADKDHYDNQKINGLTFPRTIRPSAFTQRLDIEGCDPLSLPVAALMYQQANNHWLRKLAHGRELYLIPTGVVFTTELLSQLRSRGIDLGRVSNYRARQDVIGIGQVSAPPSVRRHLMPTDPSIPTLSSHGGLPTHMVVNPEPHFRPLTDRRDPTRDRVAGPPEQRPFTIATGVDPRHPQLLFLPPSVLKDPSTLIVALNLTHVQGRNEDPALLPLWHPTQRHPRASQRSQLLDMCQLPLLPIRLRPQRLHP